MSSSGDPQEDANGDCFPTELTRTQSVGLAVSTTSVLLWINIVDFDFDWVTERWCQRLAC